MVHLTLSTCVTEQRSSTCATMKAMAATVGLKELRQDASEIVRRVQGGEQIDITVSGRLAARLVPATPRRWQRWEDVADLFKGRADPDWRTDRDLIDQSPADPWKPGPAKGRS
jgi:prevent-host-death family protein